MNCPFCGSPMEKGKLVVDGRLDPRWIPDGMEVRRRDWFFGPIGKRILGLPQRKAFDAHFQIDTHHCAACAKFIFSGQVSRW